MFRRIIRDSFFGTLAYHVSGRKVFIHEEERPSYIIPPRCFCSGEESSEFRQTEGSEYRQTEGTHEQTPGSILDGVKEAEHEKSQVILVTWDGDDDPENPYNWPFFYKCLFILKISILTAFIYMASAIYTPGLDLMMEKMHIGRVKATLPLSLFVFGYGIGPMLLSPLSEDARVGRTLIYGVSTFVFFLLQIPTAMVSDITSLCVLRFLGGIFGSPCLATGSASVGDITPVAWMPVSLAIWSAAQVSAPSFGPIIGAGLISDSGSYHWPFWFVCIASGTLFLFLGMFLPESSSSTLLYRKAERLRRLTGNPNIMSQGHIDSQAKHLKVVISEMFWRPIEIMLCEPVVLLINLYLGLIYAILYLWFEAFPILYYETYGFSLVGMGASYISQIVGLLISACVYLPIIYHIFTKKLLAGHALPPEVHIPICIVGGFVMSFGMIIFAWTASASIPWIASMIGAGAFMFGAFFVYQTLFNYLGMSFYQYLASVFAGNTLFRAIMGGSFPLFGTSLFVNLKTEKYPIAWGTTILAIVLFILILVPILFYLNGPKLRARSKYASKF